MINWCNTSILRKPTLLNLGINVLGIRALPLFKLYLLHLLNGQTKTGNLFASLNIPPKLRHFLRRVCNKLLATKQNLYSRRCSATDKCQICSQCSESMKHLLFGCAWTKAAWFGSGLGVRIEFHQIHSFQKWFSEIQECIKDVELCKLMLCPVA